MLSDPSQILYVFKMGREMKSPTNGHLSFIWVSVVWDFTTKSKTYFPHFGARVPKKKMVLGLCTNSATNPSASWIVTDM